MKVYQRKQITLKQKPYHNPEIFFAYLEYISNQVFHYPTSKHQLKTNIEQLFWSENSGCGNPFYNGVIAYGEVQSGKTANMLASMIYAYDLGFRYVFVLTGNIENLHNQTQQRFRNTVSDFNHYIGKNDWGNLPTDHPIRIIHEKKLGKNLLIELRNLQSVGDIDLLLDNPSLKSNLNVFFSLKNSANYSKIIEILRETNFSRGRNSVLILDDEADWGNKNQEVYDSEANQLYKQLLEMKHLALNDHRFHLKYIAFTATPYKLIETSQSLIQDLKNNIVLLKTKVIEPWMSEEHIFRNQPFYVGINNFLTPHKEISYQDPIIKSALNRNFITEIEDNYIDDEWLLKLSVYTFLLNSYLFKEASNQIKSDKPICGLYFTDTHRSTHNEEQQLLIDLLPSLKKEVESMIEKTNSFNPLVWEANKSQYISEFLDIIINEYNSFLAPLKQLIENKFRQMSLATLKNALRFSLEWIKKVLIDSDSLIIKMSGEEDEEKRFSNKKFDDYLNACFIIGGYKIARGVTFENLVYECLVKSSNQYDSTLQRARWLGYRSLSLLSTMDLVLSKSVVSSFKRSVNFDNQVRDAVRQI